MSWSYSGNPSSSALDAVRFLINDTDISAQLISDEEILYLLAQENNNVYLAAARAAEQVGAVFGRRGSISVGDLSRSYGEQASFYASLAHTLRMQHAVRAGAGTAVYTGGTKSDKRTREQNTDRVEPAFTVKTGFSRNHRTTDDHHEDDC